jgi:hypothetical protein
MSNYEAIIHRLPDSEIRFIQRTDSDGTIWTIPEDPENSDYQTYLAWVAKGKEAEKERKEI